MIQIFGAGIAGSYLYHLLGLNGYDASIFDVRGSVDCRCAWGIAYKEAKECYRDIGVNIDDYILVRPRHVIANGIRLRNKNIVIFDRKTLLEELWKGVSFERRDADIIVDATGAARAVLPRIEDRLLPTLQYIERHDAEEDIYVHVTRSGYAWAFPLGDGKWHIGAGAKSDEDLKPLIEELRRRYGFCDVDANCSCRAKVRMLPPSKCRPFVSGNVYGVGEAIGCVSGAGEGNAPSLISARIFFECLESRRLEEYEQRILSEFWWIEEEQRFVDAMLKGNVIGMLVRLPKIVKIESSRTVEHTLSVVKSLLGL